MKRVGLYGGSFDPVHVGHLHAARAARETFGLERVLFVPAARSPHKAGTAVTPGVHRAAMLRLAIAGEPGFELWEEELRRGGLSYTIDTVRALEAVSAPDEPLAIHLILGGDNLRGLADWREVEELLFRVQPVVVWRDECELEALEALRARLGEGICERLRRGLLHLPPVPVSASVIREQLARGEDPGRVLPPGVFDYARRNALYSRA